MIIKPTVTAEILNTDNKAKYNGGEIKK
jgi:hypothetical protein